MNSYFTNNNELIADYAKLLWGKTFYEFGKLKVIRQYFTQPNLSPFFVKLSTSR